MPARDRFHEAVRRALTADGWTITHDPYRLVSGRRNLYVDLGAERLIAAERGVTRVAVEVKTFQGLSDISDLEQAVGQHAIYRILLDTQEPARKLFLGVPEEVWKTLFVEPLGAAVRERLLDRIVRFDPQQERIIEWMPPPSGET